MVGNYGYFRLQITPKSRIGICNGALAQNSQYFTVDSVPLSSAPGVKILSSSSSASIESPNGISVIFAPAAINYLISKGLAKTGSLEVEAVGFLNQDASFAAGSNQISAASYLDPSATGTFSLQSQQSEIGAEELRAASIRSLPYTGIQKASMFMVAVFGVLLMAAAAGALKISEKFKRR